jgi:hypothetical protein
MLPAQHHDISTIRQQFETGQRAASLIGTSPLSVYPHTARQSSLSAPFWCPNPSLSEGSALPAADDPSAPQFTIAPASAHDTEQVVKLYAA